MNPYVSLLIMAAVAFVVAVGGLALSAIVSPNKRNRVKTANYECGIDPTPANTEHGRFPVGFYLVGMTFIIFDVEVVFLYSLKVKNTTKMNICRKIYYKNPKI